jgi:hypothetical protein
LSQRNCVTLLSFDNCIVCPSIYSFWLPLWYLHTGIIWQLHCLSFDLQLLITLVVSSHRYHFTIVLSVLRFTASDYPCGIFTPLSFDHCIVCPSIYSFWFPLWYLHTAIILPLHCPSFDLQLLISLVVSSHRYHLTITLYVLRFTASDYPCGIFTLLSFDHYIVCPSIYSFLLPLWYLQTFLDLFYSYSNVPVCSFVLDQHV